LFSLRSCIKKAPSKTTLGFKLILGRGVLKFCPFTCQWWAGKARLGSGKRWLGASIPIDMSQASVAQAIVEARGQ